MPQPRNPHAEVCRLSRLPTLEGRGFEILEDAPQPHALGFYRLWKALHLIASATPEERPHLLRGAPEVDAPPSLRDAVAVLQSGLASGEVDTLAAPVRAVAEWCSVHGAPLTAIRFAHISVLLAPRDAQRMVVLAKLLRGTGRHAVARMWFAWGHRCARRAKDYATAARARIGAGIAWGLQGQYKRERRCFLRAVATARRYGLSDVRAEALHELMLNQMQAGNPGASRVTGEAALRVYPSNHPHFIPFQVDFARVRLAAGEFEDAYRVFEWLRYDCLPAHRPWVHAFLATAAAGTQRSAAFRVAWNAAWEMLRDVPGMVDRAHILLELARASVIAGDLERIRESAAAALQEAQKRQEWAVAEHASEILSALRHHQEAA